MTNQLVTTLGLDIQELPRYVKRDLIKLQNKTFRPPFGIDAPDTCTLGENYWNNHPDYYEYKFDSLGFRGSDTTEYLKDRCDTKVNICVGDCNTLNLGGPVEHSWPAILSKKLSEPTLNLGVNGLSSYYYPSLINKAKSLWNVDKIFLLYNLYDEKTEVNNNIITESTTEIDIKLKFLRRHICLPTVYWQFVPTWSETNVEKSLLYSYFPESHNYLKGFRFNWKLIDYQAAMYSDVLNLEYKKIAGSDWISYAEFIKYLTIDSSSIFQFFKSPIDQSLIKEFLNGWVFRLLVTNRDGVHMSKLIHQRLANYFYNQVTKNY